MILKFRYFCIAALVLLLGLTPLNDTVIIDGKRFEIVRVGPLRKASGDVRAFDSKSGKELWSLQVTKPYPSATVVGLEQRAALVSLSQSNQKLIAYDDQANRYEIDPKSGKIAQADDAQ